MISPPTCVATDKASALLPVAVGPTTASSIGCPSAVLMQLPEEGHDDHGRQEQHQANLLGAVSAAVCGSFSDGAAPRTPRRPLVGPHRPTPPPRGAHVRALAQTALRPEPHAGRSWGPIAPRRRRGARMCAPWLRRRYAPNPTRASHVWDTPLPTDGPLVEIEDHREKDRVVRILGGNGGTGFELKSALCAEFVKPSTVEGSVTVKSVIVPSVCTLNAERHDRTSTKWRRAGASCDRSGRGNGESRTRNRPPSYRTEYRNRTGRCAPAAL